MSKTECDIGVLGLGVMGRSFALNMADRGFRVGVYNRTEEKTVRFLEEQAGGRPIEAGSTLQAFAEILKRPRAVLIFVPAGAPVDETIDELIPLLDPGDLVVDCGNSHFKDTDRRNRMLAGKGLLFLGLGVSGGESGARTGPSLMPGGSGEAYRRIRSILEASAARVGGEPCVAYLGPGSAGHYVKMVHNGIEYGLMELIAESYDLLRRGLDLSVEQLASTYAKWNEGVLNSYLIEITARVLERKDEKTGRPLVELIADRARQKGTGRWTSMDALDLKTPVPTLDTAVTMRNLSDRREERETAARVLGPEAGAASCGGDREAFLPRLEQGLLAAMILAYAQGMSLLKQASRSYGYGLDMSAVTGVWRGGCIIRSALLEEIRGAFREEPDLANPLLSPALGRAVMKRRADLVKVVSTAAELGVPVPGFMSALAWFDALRSARLPANLIMAQRDYFGAHRYERVDEEGTFHTQWEA
ncbi:MAG: NADP-dependent phosphogluconate dehydrogenase [Deltaproteobacteria bacterium]|nr:NADP-dependent phosphogluconate dehydrogenase [Deltaproteobacteria bacterium]